LYNELNKNKISNIDAQNIIIGSEEEDNPIYRTVNHFYDPIHNKGLLSSFIPAYDWAENTKAQAMYSPRYVLLAGLLSIFSSDADYSFDRAVYEYVWGNKQKGLETLGHIVHLIEDMSVPAHTRDDQHIDGDYYETYSKKYDIKTIDDISGEIIKNGEKPKKFSSLFDFFFSLSNYSNNNFFSEDTIFSENFVKPQIDFEKNDLLNNTKFGYKNLEGKNIKLVRVKERNSIIDQLKTKKEFFISDNNNLILSDYWSHLSKQAVLHASGVISFFFEKVNEEKDTMALFDKNRESIKKLFGAGLYQKQSANVISSSEREPVAELGELNAENINSNSKSQNSNLQSENQNEQNINENQNIKKSEIQQNEQIVVEPTLLQNNPIQPALNLQEEQSKEFQYTPGFGGGGGGSSPVVNNYPVIALTGNASVTITKGDLYTDAGASASDTEDGDITSNIIKTGTVDIETVGTYTLEYNVIDSGGLAATEITRTVIVQSPTIPSRPIIITPSTQPFSISTTTIIFSGTASSTLLITNDFSNATTTVDENNNWSLSISNFLEGTTTISFYASNSSYATSSATEFSVIVDITAPTISLFNVLECDYSLKQGSCLSGNNKINLTWNTTSADVSQYKIFKNDIEIATTTAKSYQILSLTNGTYNIYVTAVDSVGNTSTSTTKSVEVFDMPVVINEIAWSGTNASASDEWIELYNRSSYTIDLSNTKIIAEDGVPQINFSGTIPANSFYLVERTDDNTLNVLADFVTAFGGEGAGSGLGNEGEVLFLQQSFGGNATSTIDSTPSLADCGGSWCAGTSATEYRSMERINPDIAGNISTNWNSNNTYRKSGNDANGNPVNGTPKSRNSVNVSSSGIGYLCGPYVNSFQEGQTYTPQPWTCTYIFPDFRTVAAYGDLYKGVVGASTILTGHSLKNHITTNVEKNEVESYMNDLINGDKIFIAIYETGGVGANITAFRNYFETGSQQPPVGLKYSVLNWIYGE